MSENSFNMTQKDRPTAAELRALDEVCQELVRQGVIVDSGRKKWSQRHGRYEIIWEQARRQEGLIKSQPTLRLRPEHIADWDLPTRPTKASDNRAKAFSSASVELDAIEPYQQRE